MSLFNSEIVKLRYSMFIVLFISPQIFISQVLINEVTAANYGGLQWSETENPEDWLELKNYTDSDIDIGGYWLSDDSENPMKYEIAAGTIIAAQDFYLFFLSDLGETALGSLYPHTNFNLTQLKAESIVISDAEGNILDEFSFSTSNYLLADHSFVRDSELNWHLTNSPSPLVGNATDLYNGYSILPEADIEGGYYASAVTVILSNSNSGPIYYTTNGQEPSSGDMLYTGSITIAETTVLRARTIPEIPDLLPGRILTNTYFIGDDEHDIQVVAISGPDLGSGNWLEGFGYENKWTHIEFFDEEGTFVVEGTGDSNKHGHDSNAFPQRGFDFVCRDQIGYTRELEFPEPLFENSSSRTDYQRLIFKCGGSENYPDGVGEPTAIRDMYNHLLVEECDMAIDVRTGEFCVLYINGEYWGIYTIREKVDDRDYMEFRYDQPKYQVDYTKTWGGTWNEMGENGFEEWGDVVDFGLGNDLSDAANYTYIQDYLQKESMIDFFILNSTAVNRSWLNWDLSWWKGNDPDGEQLKWRYSLWDTDHTWGNGINYTGIPNMGSDAGHFDYLTLNDPGGHGHVPLIAALLENDSFEFDYSQRRTELQSECFSCEQMIDLLDSLVQVIEPEMQRHTDRWGGDVEDWMENIGLLEEFIGEVCEEESNSIEARNELEFLVYPNPTTSDFTIDLGNNSNTSTVEIRTVLGRLILAQEFENEQLLSFSLNEPAGVYLITVNSGDRLSAFRLLVE